MWSFLAFIAVVAAMIAVSELASGRLTSGLGALAVAALAGALFWRNMRDPAKRRAGGRKARITFEGFPGDGLDGPGTFATIRDYHGTAWRVVLDRTPIQSDFSAYGRAFGGWVWLNADDLPARVKITFGNTWQSHDVRAAQRVTPAPSG